MIEINEPELMAQRKALRLLALTVAFGVATFMGVMMSASTASAGEESGHVRRASCTVVRYYVTKYSAPVAEAYARSKGATDAEKPLGAVSCLNKPHRLATWIEPFDPLY